MWNVAGAVVEDLQPVQSFPFDRGHHPDTIHGLLGAYLDSSGVWPRPVRNVGEQVGHEMHCTPV